MLRRISRGLPLVYNHRKYVTLSSFPFNVWNVCLCLCVCLFRLCVCVCVGGWALVVVVVAELPEDCRGRWETFVEQTLKETNRKNTIDLVNAQSPITHTPVHAVHACQKKTHTYCPCRCGAAPVCVLCSRSALGPCGIPPKMTWKALSPKSSLYNRCTHP